MKRTAITPQFVDLIPKELAEGVLYVSRKYATATHRCLCGCGTKIVTPLKPGFWQLAVEKGRVSLHPSVGNWNHPCQSHYIITRNGVRWVGAMSAAQIARGRARDKIWVDGHYGGAAPSAPTAPPQLKPEELIRDVRPAGSERATASGSFWTVLLRWLFSR